MKKPSIVLIKAFIAIIILFTQNQKAFSQCSGYASALSGTTGTITSAANAVDASNTTLATLGTGAAIDVDLGLSFTVNSAISVNISSATNGVAATGSVFYSSDDITYTLLGAYNVNTLSTTGTILSYSVPTGTRYVRVSQASNSPRLHIVNYQISPTVNAISNQAICKGFSTTAINFTGTATHYNWTNNNTSIGLAASGTGNISAFTGTNTGSTAIISTISVTPIAKNPMAYICNSNANTVSVINTTTNAVVATLSVGTNPRAVSASPDGTRVYVTNNGSANVSVINTATNAVIATIPVGNSPVGVIVSADGSKAYVSNYNDNSITVINTATNTIITTIVSAAFAGPNGMIISPDGSKLYVSNYQANSVVVINTSSNAIINSISGVGMAIPAGFGMAITPDGSKLYVANYGANVVSVINTATNTVTTYIIVGATPWGVTISPDGSKLYVSNSGTGSVSVINTSTGTVMATISVGGTPFGTSISPDGSKLYVANSSNNNVSVINTATNTVLTTVTVGLAPAAFGNFIANTPACIGTPLNFTITVNPTPAVPTATAQSFCGGTTIASLVPAPSATIKWYNVATGGTALASSTAISTSGTYYVSQTSAAGCESNRTSVTTTINTPVLAVSNLTQTLAVSANILFHNNCNNLIASVNPNGADPINGNTTAKVWIEGTQPTNYVKRHYEITPDNNATNATAKVTLYFTQTEFNDFNAINTIKLPTAATDATGKANLLIEKRSGVSSNGTGLPSTYTGNIVTIDPADTDIIWNATASRWEVSFDLTGFSGFFVKTQAGILPLRLLSFTASKLPNANVQLQWQANNEVNVNRYEIESSTTANNFTKIGTVMAASLNSYQLTDNSDWNSEVRYYRLKMIDNNGTFKYSTVVRVSNKQVDGSVTIYPNPVKDVFTIQVTDKKLLHTTAQLVDVNGKLIRLINLNNSYQNESVFELPSGLYILKFVDGSIKKVIKE